MVVRLFGQGDDPGRPRPLLVADEKGVFAGLVAEIGDGFAVGRPGRLTLRARRRVGDVADVPFLHRHGDDLAAGLEDGALAAGGDVGVEDEFAGRDIPRTAQDALAGNVDDQLPDRPLLEQVQVALALKDNGSVMDAERLDVNAGVAGKRLDLLAARMDSDRDS